MKKTKVKYDEGGFTLTNGDILNFSSEYEEGDLVKYAKTPKPTRYNTPEKKTQYSVIEFVRAKLRDGNVVELQYKMENGKIVDHIDIISVEKKNEKV